MGSNTYSKNEETYYRTLNTFIKKQKKMGFEPGGIGAGVSHDRQTEGKDNYFGLMFHLDEKLTVESARELSINLVNEFLAHINNNEKMRDNLIEYPLTEKYVSISIWGQNQDANISTEKYIKSVRAGGGKVRYYIDSMAPPNLGLIYEETFEEAERVLKKDL